MSDRGAEPSAEGEPAALDPDVGGRASAERSSQQHPGHPFVDFRAMCFNAYKGLHNGQTPAQRGEGKQFEAKCLSQWKEVGADAALKERWIALRQAKSRLKQRAYEESKSRESDAQAFCGVFGSSSSAAHALDPVAMAHFTSLTRTCHDRTLCP